MARFISIVYFFCSLICFTAGTVFKSELYALGPSENVKTPNKNQDKKLARVAVINFIDEKNQPDYAYLSVSLSEAIETKLKNSFVYVKTLSTANERVFKDILGKRKKVKNKQKKKEARFDLDRIKGNIRTLSRENKLDVVVFGSYYSYQKAGKEGVSQIVVKPHLYLSFFGEFIELEDATNPIDSTIFEVTDKAANILVDKISALIGLQQALKLAVIAPQYLSAGRGEGILRSQIAKKQREQTLLNREIGRLKKYLTSVFEGGIFTLSEYAAKHDKIKAPAANRKSDLSRWQAQYKVDTMIRLKLDGEKLVITLDQKGRPAFSVNYSAFFLMSSDIEDAYSKLGSVLRERSGVRPPLRKENFTRSWNAVYFEAGAAAGVGMMFLGGNSLLSPQGRVFARFSPGVFSERYDIGWLSDFTHPLLKPVFFDLSFGFSLAQTSSEDRVPDQKGNNLQDQLSLGISSFSLGICYSWVFLRRMKLLAGASFAWYLAVSRNSFTGDSLSAPKEANDFIFGPSLLGYTSLHYLLFFHLSLGIRVDYIHYFNQSVSESSAAESGRAGLSMEVTYVF